MKNDFKMLLGWISMLEERYPSDLLDVIREQAKQLDEMAGPVMELDLSQAYAHYAKAAFARTWTQFLGIIEMVLSKNYHCGFVLLRAHLEVLATTVYVERHPKQINNILNNIAGNKRPPLNSRIQVLAKEKGSGFKRLYRHLTHAFHFNEGRYVLKRGQGQNYEGVPDVDIKVYQDGPLIPAQLLLILAQITGEQIKALKTFIDVP